MLWFFLMVMMFFGFVVLVSAAFTPGARPPADDALVGKEVARKREVQAKAGTFDVVLIKMPSAYEDRCYRIELMKNGMLVHKNIDFFDQDASYTEVIKGFIKEFDRRMAEKHAEEQAEADQRFEVEVWDGDVYEDNVTEIPKRVEDKASNS
ncbi:hypothetical protein [Alkalicoccus chagannorensis]|uniref:hypothetical protein n=1 Tax=Alkalicoccus chagannorensis TaxID=427072 RepID=UPI00047E6C07|nr:hypothetical protein [Alkalicoccus chagannorensis]